jgi:two-component system, chemotaxis family, sensor kinase CheA
MNPDSQQSPTGGHVPERGEEPSIALLPDLAAILIGLDADSYDELSAIRDQLDRIAAGNDLPAEVIALLVQAVEFLEATVTGKAPDRAKSLEQAGDAIDIALETFEQRLEDSLENSSNGGSAQEPSAESGPEVQFDSPVVLPDDVDLELLAGAQEEFLEHLDGAEASLLALEADPEDPDLLGTIFRAFHTIKGASSFLGLEHIKRIAHLTENLFGRARDGEIQILGVYADVSLKSCDSLRGMIEVLTDFAPGDELPLPEDFGELLTRLLKFDAETKGEAPAPPPVAKKTVAPPPVVEKVVEAPSEPKTVEEVPAVSQEVPAEATPAPPVAKAPMSAPPPPAEKVVAPPKPAVAKKAPAPSAKQNQARQKKGDTSVRVSTDRLDSLIDMVGELVIAHSMLAQEGEENGADHERDERKVTHIGKITRELQDLSMALRMVPLKATFDKMRRVVRDLAQKSGKAVEFVTEGDNTEIDRTMVEAINDPLVHMIRNSVDHGIEDPEGREVAGKPTKGVLRLCAYHAAGNVVIEINDDGRGLDRDKILAKAIEREVIPANRSLSDPEIYELIFRAGFSTADKVTDVSGRGVGMDVVKRGIEALRGRIKVDSTMGQGTNFMLQFPLTLAIADAMLVVVGSEQYLMPTMSIQQSFHPEANSITTVVGKGEVVMNRGELIPIVRLHELFDIPEAVSDAADGILIVVDIHGEQYALLADELRSQHQVVIKSLGATVGKIPGISGGAILGDGRVGLILDGTGLLSLSRQARDTDVQASPLVAAA